MSEEKLVPKLRFSGFNDIWKKVNLGEISKIGKGFTPSTSNPSFWDGELYWLSIADMNQGKYIKQTSKKISLEGSKNKDPIEKGTLLMSFKLSLGKLGILTKDMYTNEAICNFKWKNNNISTEYMYYYLSSINIMKYGSQAAKGITLNNETLNTIPVILPNFDEQNKISNFLSKIDKKIELLEKKHQAYEDFKKYLMQQIFTQKLRFDFTYEWDKYLLGDISIISKGFTPSTSNPDYWDGNLKWLSIADMNQGKYINQTTKKITYEGSKNKEPIKKGTLLMSFKLSIGKLGILNEDMYTNEAICNFQWKNKKIMTEYMYYYLSSINILKYGSQAAKGITLNNETLSAIPVLLPSIEEQNKIIDILSNLDLKINMLENNINITSKFKKGLLQQMFV